MRGNYRARKESLRSWISLCPIVATRDNGRIHIVHLQARLHTCTLDDTLFKYLVMNGRALAREHLTYAPLHDRMLHISYIGDNGAPSRLSRQDARALIWVSLRAVVASTDLRH